LVVLIVGVLLLGSMKRKSWTVDFVINGHNMSTCYSSGLFESRFYYPNTSNSDGCRGGGYFAYISLKDELILIGDEHLYYNEYASQNSKYPIVKVISNQPNNDIEFTDIGQLSDYLVKTKRIDVHNVEIGNIFREIERQGKKTKVKGLRSEVKLGKYLKEADGKIIALKGYLSYVNK
jgi:hypothetical protein